MAGGNDSLSRFKERVQRPKAVIDISGIVELQGVRKIPDGVAIGSLTTLTEIECNPVIHAKYRMLADAGGGSRARKSAIPARLAISPRTRVAGIPGTVCPPAGPAETPALPTRRKGPTLSTRCRRRPLRGR